MISTYRRLFRRRQLMNVCFMLCPYYCTKSPNSLPSTQILPHSQARKGQLEAERLQEIQDYYAQYEKQYSIAEKGNLKKMEDNFVEDFNLANTVPFPLKRGVRGVFELHELIDFLKMERANDIVVLEIPEYYQYADYMVIVSVRALRHMNALQERLRLVWKAKKKKRDQPLHVEGRDSNPTWRAVDLGNIVLHLFEPTTREKYDLESLWTVGPEFDELTLKKSKEDALQKIIDQHTVVLE